MWEGKIFGVMCCMNTGTKRVVMLIQPGRPSTAGMKSLNQEISKSKNHQIKKQHFQDKLNVNLKQYKSFLTTVGLLRRTMYHKDMKI